MDFSKLLVSTLKSKLDCKKVNETLAKVIASIMKAG